MCCCNICGRETDKGDRYHSACLQTLFGSSRLPTVDLSLSEISIEAQKMAGKMSISGVQPKLSIVRAGSRLVPVQMGGRFILKPQTQTFRHLPENENLCMNIAANLGIDVPLHGLFDLKDGSKAYIVCRFDRTEKGEKKRCEDFAQILGQKKYAGSVEQMGHMLKQISEFPGLDVQLLFERILLFFLLGNGDAHLKNYSILETSDGSLRLSPAYDIVCSKLVIPDEGDSALTINGKHDKIKRYDFEALSERLDIPMKARDNIFGKMNAVSEIAKQKIPGSYLPVKDQKKVIEIIEERVKRIFG